MVWAVRVNSSAIRQPSFNNRTGSKMASRCYTSIRGHLSGRSELHSNGRGARAGSKSKTLQTSEVAQGNSRLEGIRVPQTQPQTMTPKQT